MSKVKTEVENEVIEGEFEEVSETAAVVVEKESGLKKLRDKASKHKGKIVTVIVAGLGLGIGYALGSKSTGSESTDGYAAYNSDEEDEDDSYGSEA